MTFATEVDTITDMLSYARPDGSKTERAFHKQYIKPLGVHQDGEGNFIKRIGTAPVLWSCHTDTVHMKPGRQLVIVENGIAKLSSKSTMTCLGADDTAGVWLMREMIRAGKPGLYVFHRAEEVGGLGSRFIANKTPELLKGIKCAIALDRGGKSDVITHQGDRCCSDAFAWSLAGQLNMGYSPDNSGTFTDTANYTDLIGECTNISVGYNGAHSKRETLDLGFLTRLRDSLLEVDVDALDYERQPGDIDPDAFDYNRLPAWARGGATYDTSELEELCRDHPDVAADLLEQVGIDAVEFRSNLRDIGRA